MTPIFEPAETYLMKSELLIPKILHQQNSSERVSQSESPKGKIPSKRSNSLFSEQMIKPTDIYLMKSELLI